MYGGCARTTHRRGAVPDALAPDDADHEASAGGGGNGGCPAVHGRRHAHDLRQGGGAHRRRCSAGRRSASWAGPAAVNERPAARCRADIITWRATFCAWGPGASSVAVASASAVSPGPCIVLTSAGGEVWRARARRLARSLSITHRANEPMTATNSSPASVAVSVREDTRRRNGVGTARNAKVS